MAPDPKLGGKTTALQPEQRPSYGKKPLGVPTAPAGGYADVLDELSPLIDPWIAANPERRGEIRNIAWTWGRDGNYDQIIDELLQGGFTLPEGASGGGGGRGRGGGGGGGGASLAQQIDGAIAQIRNRSRELGFNLDDAAISALASTVVTNNWTAAQLDDYLLQDATVTPTAGTITATVDQIKQLAAQQLITISDATAMEYARRIASSEQTVDGVRSLLATQAATQYGWAADLVQQGVTVRDILLPARDMIASTLEIAPESVDLLDSKYLGMVQTRDDKGQIRAATLGEVAQRARADDRFKDTVAARQSATGVGVELAKMFMGG